MRRGFIRRVGVAVALNGFTECRWGPMAARAGAGALAAALAVSGCGSLLEASPEQQGDCTLALHDFEGVPLEPPYEVPMVSDVLGGEATAEVQYVAEGWGPTTVETVDPAADRASAEFGADSFNEDLNRSVFDRPGTWQVRVSDTNGCMAAFAVEVEPPLQ